MSVDVYDLDPCPVQGLRHPRARKPHRCDACGETIPRGHRYWVETWLSEGEWSGAQRCERCEALYRHLHEVCADAPGCLQPEPRLDCGQDYEDEWGEVPPEIARLAFVTPAEMQAESEAR